MFSGASSFNQPLNDWNVSSATDMDFMFFQANDFDQNLGEWYVVLNSTEIDASRRRARHSRNDIGSEPVPSRPEPHVRHRNGRGFGLV
jgi:surface protein